MEDCKSVKKKRRNTDEMSDEMRRRQESRSEKRQGIPFSSAADTLEMFST